MMHKENRGLKLRRSAALIFFLLLLEWRFAAALEIGRIAAGAADSLEIHARYLASDELTGRGVGTPGIKLARDYIAREFAGYGLRPGGDNKTYLQSFQVTTGVKVAEPSLLSINGETPLELNAAWGPLGFSKSGKAEGEVVFAGYGITAKEYGYDDYQGIDANGKIVLVLRYEPVPKSDKSPFRKAPRFSSHATLRSKANNARAHGATAMILVDLNQAGASSSELISTGRSLARGANSLIAAQIKRRVVESWLKERGISLAALKEKIDHAERPASLALPNIRVTLTVTLEEVREPAENVVGFIPGSDPRLNQEHIVIGAHYDHLGFGHFGTSDASAEGKVHHGADDNASGTALLLAIARQLATADHKPARAVVLVAFSGEELGLYGSRHYTDQPALPIASARAMINLDMVGRLRDNRVTVFGTRSAKEISAIVSEEAGNLGLAVSESDGIGRSDNMSFYNKKVPALHFFTGTHGDYHRPSDTWDKLNYEGMSRIGALVLAVTGRFANTPQPFQFVALASRPRSRETAEGAGLRSYLGSIPDYEGADDGVKLAGVSPGSPAALAGLQGGDVITEFAGARILNIEDLMEQLSTRQPGDEVEIVVRRASLARTVKATLAARE